jgi:hypothetical protein
VQALREQQRKKFKLLQGAARLVKWLTSSSNEGSSSNKLWLK